MTSKLPVVLAAFSLALINAATAGPPGDDSTTDSPAAVEGLPSADQTWQSEKRQTALRIQLFLDREGFGPGKIDGRWGDFTKKAAERWNESGGERKIQFTEIGDPDPAKTGVLPVPGELTITYEVSAKDKSLLGNVPAGPKEMAKLKSLPYTSLMELVAEKFHADLDYLREINGLAPDADLSVGAKINVPNVAEPFDIEEPMRLADEAKEKKVQDSNLEKPEKNSGKPTEANGGKPKPALEVTVLRDKRLVEVRQAGKIVHSFPITPGANDNVSPAGEWKVSTISWMPEFRWDKSMLEDGQRSDDSYLLPPGPNNPVGIVWIGLNADGIGLHGTPNPDEIGRNRSHGCIRLSNWDALKLAKTVSPETPVIVK